MLPAVLAAKNLPRLSTAQDETTSLEEMLTTLQDMTDDDELIVAAVNRLARNGCLRRPHAA